MFKQIHQEEWVTLIITWLLLLITSLTIWQADLMDGLHVLPLLGTGGLLLGFVLSKSKFLDNTSHLLAIVYGIFFVGLFSGLAIAEDLSWQERIITISDRQFVWFQKAFTGGTSRDGLIFLIHTSLVFWLLGYIMSWFTFHYRRIWWVLLPCCLIILSVIYYAPARTFIYLAAYALVGLIYISQTYLVSEQQVWRKASVYYKNNISLSFWQSSLIFGLFALLIAWSIPTPTANASVNQAMSQVNAPWRKMQESWTRLFSSLQLQGLESSDSFRENLILGGPRTVPDTIIMDVYVPEPLPITYWKAINYDLYEDGGWSISKGSISQIYAPDIDLIQLPNDKNRRLIIQQIINYRPNSSFIYGAPDIIGSDRQLMIRYKETTDQKQIIESMQSRVLLRQGESYEVQSRISTANATDLRQANQNYPTWVTEQYLQVPDTITDRTLQLAVQLTESQENPFDKAIVIRDYLRRTIKYNDQIDAPPTDREPIDYILFDLKEGYCNYYASAMTIMLRSLGIPARMAAGYVQGDYNEESSFYRVRAESSHSWVEVYFPEYGWIQFEPTASITPIDRPDTGEVGGGADGFDANDPNNDASNDPLNRDDLLPEDDPSLAQNEENDLSQPLDPATNGSSERNWWLIAGGIILVALATVASFTTMQWNLKIETDLNKSYDRLTNWAKWLGLPVAHTQTPYERAHQLSVQLPEGKNEIRSITTQFVQTQFGPEKESIFDPSVEWKLLRPKLIRKLIENGLQKLPFRRKE